MPESATLPSATTKLEYLRKDLEDLRYYLDEFSAFLPLPVIIVNPLGFILDINQAFENLIGLKKAGVLGSTVAKLFCEQEQFAELEARVLKGEVIKGARATLLLRDRQISRSLYLSPRHDCEKNIIGYFLGIYDISENVKLTEGRNGTVCARTIELEEKSEDLLRSRAALMNILEDVAEEQKKVEQERDKTLAIIKNLADGILIFDPHNVLTLINPQAKEMMQLDESSVVGKMAAALTKVTNIMPLINFLGLNIKKVYRKQLELKSDKVLEISAFPFLTGRETLGKMVILHDITREKAIETMKTEFVSVVAHQLRTPLTTVKWSLHLLLHGNLGAITAEQRDLLMRTDEHNERLIGLVNYLLDVARIEQGRFVLRNKNVDFIKLAETVIAPFLEVSKNKQLNFKFIKPREKVLPVNVDEEKMVLVIENLVDNEVNYTPPHGNVTVSLSFDKAKSEVLFTVKDTGIGIPEDNKQRIFTKFYRAENAAMASTSGSGLGLFITKNIIEGHGGRIWFESIQSKGSTFSFTLPLK